MGAQVRFPRSLRPGRPLLAEDLLLGRAKECAHLDAIVTALSSGESRVLVLRGDPGVGKSALLSYVEDSAHGLRVLHAHGVEPEQDLEFAALHQLCLPLLDGLPTLPEPQRTAIATVFGTRAGPRPDHFLVGLAVLNLMSAASAQIPLLCLVDDAQWLDHASAQVLAFVARRLLAESIGIVLGTRQPGPSLRGLPELEVVGLEIPEARALLEAVVPAGLDPHIRDRMLAEARGNPLALLELPRGLTVTQIASGLGMLEADMVPSQLERSFLRRIQDLPAPTRLVLLVAAADPSGDSALVRRAVERLGVTDQAALTDEAEGLLTIDGRVTFRHPLVRSAAYRAAGAKARRAAHRALADVTDAAADPDRRAWHRAAASGAPDEAVALELEQSATLARARGGPAAAAAFLQRSAALTEDEERRSERALTAARASLGAGDLDAARRYLDEAERTGHENGKQVQLRLVRGQLALASGHPGDAGPLLLDAARQLETLDAPLAHETYLQAWGAAAAGEDEAWLREVSRSILAHPAAAEPSLLGRLLRGYALLGADDREAAVRLLRPAGAAIRTTPPGELLRFGWVAAGLGPTLWDDVLFHATCRLQVQASRDAGALTDLVRHLTSLALTTAWTGDFGAAESLITEAELLAAATGSPPAVSARLYLAALRGDAAASTLIAAAIESARESGHGGAVAVAQWSAAVLYNGLAGYEPAVRAAREAAALPAPWTSVWVLPELVEAAVRVGDRDLASEALARLVDATGPCPTDWAQGIVARCRALLVETDAADALFREAITRLGRTSWRPEVARAQLLYGEWLRRAGRRVDARRQLSEAHEWFASMGLAAFAERTRRELLATGGTPRRRAVGTPSVRELTPQERQIAGLVRDGYSNTEVAARLFLSPRTVEWHLRKVFTKLSITSRRQLRDALPPAP